MNKMPDKTSYMDFPVIAKSQKHERPPPSTMQNELEKLNKIISESNRHQRKRAGSLDPITRKKVFKENSAKAAEKKLEARTKQMMILTENFKTNKQKMRATSQQKQKERESPDTENILVTVPKEKTPDDNEYADSSENERTSKTTHQEAWPPRNTQLARVIQKAKKAAGKSQANPRTKYKSIISILGENILKLDSTMAKKNTVRVLTHESDQHVNESRHIFDVEALKVELMQRFKEMDPLFYQKKIKEIEKRYKEFVKRLESGEFFIKVPRHLKESGLNYYDFYIKGDPSAKNSKGNSRRDSELSEKEKEMIVSEIAKEILPPDVPCVPILNFKPATPIEEEEAQGEDEEDEEAEDVEEESGDDLGEYRYKDGVIESNEELFSFYESERLKRKKRRRKKGETGRKSKENSEEGSSRMIQRTDQNEDNDGKYSSREFELDFKKTKSKEAPRVTSAHSGGLEGREEQESIKDFDQISWKISESNSNQEENISYLLRTDPAKKELKKLDKNKLLDLQHKGYSSYWMACIDKALYSDRMLDLYSLGYNSLIEENIEVPNFERNFRGFQGETRDYVVAVSKLKALTEWDISQEAKANKFKCWLEDDFETNADGLSEGKSPRESQMVDRIEEAKEAEESSPAKPREGTLISPKD